MNILPNRIKASKGFTLMELMVAIAIVAVLSTVGLVIYSNLNKQARDAKRRQDIQAIAQALDTNKPPNSIYYKSLNAAQFSGGKIPQDPKTGTQEYCIWGNTTSGGAPVPPPPQPANSLNITWTDCGNTLGLSPSGNGGVVSATVFPANTITSFTVCAKLESSTNGIACVSNKI